MRISAVLQLVVFCSLAAFTGSFSITMGIQRNNNPVQQYQFPMNDGFNQANVANTNVRNKRLLNMDSRGISMTMSLSRLLLLMQYAVSAYLSPVRVIIR